MFSFSCAELFVWFKVGANLDVFYDVLLEEEGIITLAEQPVEAYFGEDS
jgi:hypothetical protein